MVEPVFNWSRYLAKLKTTKRYWVPLALAVVFGANFAGLLLPKKYDSSALVTIHEPQFMDLSGFQVRTMLSIKDRLETIREEMTSFSFLAKIARDLNLDAGIEPNSLRYEQLIRRMERSITLFVKNQDLFEITYRADTPLRARDVAAAIVNQYLINSSQYYQNKTSSAVKFLESELTEEKNRLSAAEDAVKKYKSEHITEIPEAQEANLRRLEQLQLAQDGVGF
ncbi:MAG: Wzz/FepE/Etk N-terminal domain-containing protein, partial [bacterium]|nr:Wzz/FepE/Etk N-terminal domain-containing protein [bacterium]